MKSVSRNISRHANGGLYLVARRGGKLIVRSLRTTNLARAKRLVSELGVNSIAQGALGSSSGSSSRSSSKPSPSPRFPRAEFCQANEGQSSLGFPQTDNDRMNYRVGERYFLQCLEDHDRGLIPVLLSPGARAAMARGRSAVQSYASDWVSFSPVAVWSSYRDSGILRYGRQLTSGANHVKWYLSKLVDWAISRGHLTGSRAMEVSEELKQVPRIKIPPRRIRVPEPGQVVEYFHRLALALDLNPNSNPEKEDDSLLLDFAKFLAYTGLRRAAALALTWRQVDLDSRTMEVVQKGGARVITPLTSQAFEVLKSRFQLRDRGVGPFVSIASRHLHRLGRRMKKVARDMSMDLETFHCFRHYFASRALMSGLSVAEVATLLGHRDGGVLVLQTYGHICGNRLRTAVSELRC